MAVRRSLWERCLGKQPGLEVTVRLTPPHSASDATAVTLRIQPHGCDGEQAAQLLEDHGPMLAKSVCTYLQAVPQRRSHDRFPFAASLRVCPVFAGGKLGEAIACQGKDLSLGGIGFAMPCAPATSHVYVNLPAGPQAASVAVLAKIVRARARGDGCYDVGAAFSIPGTAQPG